MEAFLAAEDCRNFDKNGLLMLKNFYSVEEEILPIQKSIYDGACDIRGGNQLARDSQ